MLSSQRIKSILERPRISRSRGDAATALALLGQDQVPNDDSVAGARVKLVPAAVLVPLIERPGGMTVLLTQRTSELKHHAGQIAFPGGRREPDDADMIACALREAEEEVGVARHAVDVLGQLDPYVTITGYEVTPVVGVLSPLQSFKPDPVEVADVFEVPLSFLMDPANHRREQREYKGLTRAYYAMVYQEHYIWGATAGMILNLFDVLSAHAPQHAGA